MNCPKCGQEMDYYHFTDSYVCQIDRTALVRRDGRWQQTTRRKTGRPEFRFASYERAAQEWLSRTA